MKKKQPIYNSLLMLAILFLFSCNDFSEKKNNNPKMEENYDSLSILKNVIYNSKKDVYSSMDSIKKYNLDSVNEKCIKYLYLIYGSTIINERDSKNKVSIGECNIQLIGFRGLNNYRTLVYGIFISDSIPYEWIYHKRIGGITDGFEISLSANKIVEAKKGALGKVSIENVEKEYQKSINNKSTKEYLHNNVNIIHTKFKIIATQLGLLN